MSNKSLMNTDRNTPETLKDTDFISKSKEVLHNSLTIFTSSNWRLEKKTTDGHQIHSHHHPKYGKIFKITTIVNFPAKFLINEFFNKYNGIPKWNTTVKEVKRIEKINDNTDIIYLIVKEVGKGIITSRDYVDLRTCCQKDGSHIIASTSVDHPKLSPSNKYVRGHSGPSCIILTPIPGDFNRCIFQFMVNTNIRGWIPQYIIDKSMSSVLIEYVASLNKYSKLLHEEKILPLIEAPR